MRQFVVAIAILVLMGACSSDPGLRRALVVIDMQNAAVHAGPPMDHIDDVIDTIRFTAHKFRERGDLVVFVQYDGTKQGEFLPGSPGAQIIPELPVESSDLVVVKTSNDSFYGSSLDQALRDHGVGQVVVCGTETDFCVNSTVQSALTRGYQVTVLSDGHTASNKGGLRGDDIVRFYNTVWALLIPEPSRVKVVSSREL